MKLHPITSPAHITVFFLALVAPHLAAAPAAAGGNKVQVCHVPPGNADNFHTITVGEKALAAHLRHGDFEGPCGDFCEILCDDGNFCTIDACDSDEACVHSPVDCNDSNSCTADACEPATGCIASPLQGSDCTIDDGNVCTTPEGTCDAVGACVPVAVPGCCNTDGECADDDLCTFEACVGNACVPNGETSCETDDCSVSVCHPATGQCTAPEPVVCEELECHANGCAPEGGCFSTPIPGCCISDAECDDGNNCTTDTCFGPDGCASTACATGDTCNTLIDCDAATCAPITEPVTCSDDGNACTAESCVPGQGCVSTPVGPFPGGESQCADGVDNDCDGKTDAADGDCAPPPAESSCNNDLDDDGDGLVDCADPDCAGELYCQCPCFTPGEARAQYALCQSIYDHWYVTTRSDTIEGDEYREFTCSATDSNGQPLPGADQLEISVGYFDFAGQRQNFCFMEELQSDEDNFSYLQNNDTTACAAAFDAI